MRPLFKNNKQLWQTRKNSSRTLSSTLRPKWPKLVVISHNPTEIILDFAQMLPGIEGASVRKRIIMNPIHAKRTLAALNDNIKKYEQQFGTIEEPRMPMQGDTVPYDIIGKA